MGENEIRSFINALINAHSSAILFAIFLLGRGLYEVLEEQVKAQRLKREAQKPEPQKLKSSAQKPALIRLFLSLVRTEKKLENTLRAQTQGIAAQAQALSTLVRKERESVR